MKQLIIVTMLCLPLSILAQEPLKNKPIGVTDTINHCARMIKQGDEFFKKNQFEKAINAYTAAQACNRERATQVNSNIARVFNAINQQKDRAVKAEKKARKAEKDAINAKNEAIKQKENAENSERIVATALKKAIAEKQKAENEQKISVWSSYAANQSVKNENHAWYLAEKGCEESHYTNSMAVSQRARLWADDDKLYYKQSFFHPLSKPVTAMAISPNERFLLAGFADGSAKIWDIRTGQIYFDCPKFGQPIRAVAVSENGTVAIVTNSLQRDKIRDTLFIDPHNDSSKGMSLTIGAATTMSNELFVWNQNSQLIHKLEGQNSSFSAVAAVSFDSNSFFTGDESGVIRHWVVHNKARKIDVQSNYNSTDIQYIFCNEKDGSFATIDRYDVVFWDSSGLFLDKWHRNDKAIVSASYSKDLNELYILQEDSTLIKLDALKYQTIEERSLNLPFKNAALSPDGIKIFVAMPDSFVVSKLGEEKGFNVGNIKKLAWVNNDYLYAIHSDKMAVSLIPFDDKSKLKTFTIPEIHPICVGVSPDARIIVAGEEEDGWLYLYKSSESKLLDSLKTEAGIKKIEFIDNQHFITLHLDGKAQLHAVVAVDSNHLRISSTLQTLDKSKGIWGYDAYRHRLVLADRHYFAMYPIAAIGQKPTAIDTIWWHEKLAYNLPINEFDAMAKYKTDPSNHRQELSSLAMMKRIKSKNDRYFNKSVNLIAAKRYAKAAKEEALSQVLSDELDSVEAKFKDRIYDNNHLFSSCLENLNQYKNDAYELDTLYHRHDPDSLYRAEASDRYASAAYMAILTGEPLEAVKLALRSMEIDTHKTWAATNLAFGYLYAGQKDAAYQVYSLFKEKYWENSGYPKVHPSDKATFNDIFLAHIYDITENYFKKDTIAFAHLKKVNFDAVKIFLNSKEAIPFATVDKSPKSRDKSFKETDIHVDKSQVNSEPVVQSKSIKRQLTKAEKILLKQIRTGPHGPIFRAEAATLLTHLEKEFSWDTTHVEIRSALAEGYFYKAWHGLFFKEFKESELSIMRSLSFDDQQYNAYAVLAHTQLFQGKLAEAKKNYTFYLGHSKKGVEEIKSDFLLFKNSNLFHKDMPIIEQMIDEISSKKIGNK